MVPGEHAPTSLIVGAGEVGKGLFDVLNTAYKGRVFIRDIEPSEGEPKTVDFLHICFPYSKKFLSLVKEYKEQYGNPIVINHSSVPVGTTAKLGKDAIHSPIRGKHPDLAGGIRTFVKFFGGHDLNIVRDVEQYFARAGVRTMILSSPEATELGKLMETSQYGWFIVLAKEIQALCDKHKLSFNEVYTIQNMTYNEGYSRLGLDHFLRPILTPVGGPIGGHCVRENSDLVDSSVTELIRKFNDKYKYGEDTLS